MSNNILSVILTTFMYSTPLVLASLGGVISECSGVINIGIEGMMSFGTFTGACVGYFSGNPWLGLLAGGGAGLMISFLHAIASVRFMADQTISGIALNLIGPGLSLFLCRIFFDGQTTSYSVEHKLPKFFSTIDITTLLALVAVVMVHFVFYKTKWGLRLRAVGEHPAAADTLGVNVYKIRYVCVFLSGFLSGLAGACITLSVVSQFSPATICGQGFIALAAVIFGKWTPFGTYIACLLFAFAQSLTVLFGSSNLIPSEILNIIPHILTIVVLILFVGKSVAPKANGTAYSKETR